MAKETLETKRPAIPPEDYKGGIGAWMIALQERGLWKGEGWYGDVEILLEVD
jgi:hypothetical protein